MIRFSGRNVVPGHPDADVVWWDRSASNLQEALAWATDQPGGLILLFDGWENGAPQDDYPPLSAFLSQLEQAGYREKDVPSLYRDFFREPSLLERLARVFPVGVYKVTAYSTFSGVLTRVLVYQLN